MDESVVYTADKIILATGQEYSNTDFYFISGFTFISFDGSNWINTRLVTKIINLRVKED